MTQNKNFYDVFLNATVNNVIKKLLSSKEFEVEITKAEQDFSSIVKDCKFIDNKKNDKMDTTSDNPSENIKNVKPKIDIELPHNLSYFKKAFQECKDIEKKVGYVAKICKDPSEYYIETMEELSYADVADYFREAIPFITNDGKLIFETKNTLNVETSCKAGTECWAYRNFKTILRSFKKSPYCICCIREVVNAQYTENTLSNTFYDVIQTEHYKVDGPGEWRNGVYYQDYSSKYMITQSPTQPFLGIYGAYPKHYKGRFLDETITVSKTIEFMKDNKTFKKTFNVNGIKEKPDVFFPNLVYNIHSNKLGTNTNFVFVPSHDVKSEFFSLIKDYTSKLENTNQPFNHDNDILNMIKSPMIEFYISLPQDPTIESIRYRFQNNIDPNKLKDAIKRYDNSFFEKCYEHKMRIPNDFYINNYDDNNSKNSLTEDLKYKDEEKNLIEMAFKDIYKNTLDNDDPSMNFYYDNIKNNTTNKINEMRNISDNIHKSRIYKEFFLYWYPNKGEKAHLREYFWFFARVNIILQMIKTCKDYLLAKYLKQIFKGLIPYMSEIEKYWYDGNKVQEIVKSYIKNFKLKYEFSFHKMKNTNENNNNKSFLIETKEIVQKTNEFYLLYSNLDKLVKIDDNNNLIENNSNYTITKNINYCKKIFKCDKSIESLFRRNKVTFTTFCIIGSYIEKENFKFINLFNVIPTLYYLLTRNYPQDSVIDNNRADSIKFMPKCISSHEMFPDLAVNGILFNIITDRDISPRPSKAYGKEGTKIPEGMTTIEMITRTLGFAMPQYTKTSIIRAMVIAYYSKNVTFRNIIDNAIICTTCGLYEENPVNNICKMFCNDKEYAIGKLLQFFSSFAIHTRFFMGDCKENSLNERINYIKKNIPKGKLFMMILHELLAMYICSDTSIYKSVKWKSNKKNGENLTSIELFVKCCWENGNEFRKHFFLNKNSKSLSLSTVKKKKKPSVIMETLLTAMKEYIDDEFFIETIFSGKLPTRFEPIFEPITMKMKFGNDWRKNINNFWKMFYLETTINSKIIGWESYFKLFKLQDSEILIFSKIFSSNSYELSNLKTIYKSTILRMTKRSKSILFYIIDSYHKKYGLIDVAPLLAEQTIYQLFTQKLNKHRYPLVAISKCCKEIRNVGDDSTCIMENGIYCLHRQTKNKVPNEMEKYKHYVEKSKEIIKHFVTNVLFKKQEDYETYKRLLYRKKNRKINDEFVWGDSKSFSTIKLTEVLKPNQIKSLKNCNEITPSITDVNINWDVDDDDEEFRSQSSITSLDNYEKYRTTFIQNISDNMKKYSCFFRKMCKWIMNSDRKNIKHRKMSLYNPIGHIITLKTRKNHTIYYTNYILCTNCEKMKEINTKRIYSYDNYMCEDCENSENNQNLTENFTKTLVINTNINTQFLSIVTE